MSISRKLIDSSKSVRERLSLDPGWYFRLGDIAAPEIKDHFGSLRNIKADAACGATAADFDDCLPNAWVVVGPLSPKKIYPKVTVQLASHGIGGSFVWKKATAVNRSSKPEH